MAGSSSRLPASRRLHDHHEHAAGGSAAPCLNGLAPGRSTLNGELRPKHLRLANTPIQYRPSLPYSEPVEPSTAPDSTKVRLLPLGGYLIVYGRVERIRPTPPWTRVRYESEAREFEAAFRVVGFLRWLGEVSRGGK